MAWRAGGASNDAVVCTWWAGMTRSDDFRGGFWQRWLRNKPPAPAARPRNEGLEAFLEGRHGDAERLLGADLARTKVTRAPALPSASAMRLARGNQRGRGSSSERSSACGSNPNVTWIARKSDHSMASVRVWSGATREKNSRQDSCGLGILRLLVIEITRIVTGTA